MPLYFFKELKVKRLWGYKDIDIDFFDDINILIGPNASGKTTILDILHHTMVADILKLSKIPFESITIRLQSFLSKQTRLISLLSTHDGYEYKVSGKKYPIDLDSIRRLRDLAQYPPYYRRQVRGDIIPIAHIIKDLLPTVWLPVSRRPPKLDEEEYEQPNRGRTHLESVDQCIDELMKDLHDYRRTLDSKLYLFYKEFERRVLGIILYSKRRDELLSVKLIPTSSEEKKKLKNAFKMAGLLDQRMKERIDLHFKIERDVIRLLKQPPSKKHKIAPGDFSIIPLMGRARQMIDFADTLEKERLKLFAPLDRFQEISNNFLETKSIKVHDDGKLKVTCTSPENESLNIHLLSSGEKQILILLIQALLSEDKPVVYIVDEPELSLHVSWQEQLLDSLKSLGKSIQIIVATHSPDIVGPYKDKIIDLTTI